MTQRQKAIKYVKQNAGTQSARVLSVLLKEKPVTSFKGMMTAKVSSWHRRLADLRNEGFNIPHGIRGRKQTWYTFPTRKISEKTLKEKVLKYEGTKWKY